ncbi:MAG: NAD(P)H-dependent oxidoreductase subunit E [Alphaproteobacteria bacterium]|nr:NAD(P)H-dependent oxidoreductase subunit E [Alphaproteobacteria bacterium]MDD9919739.1 NAD(P)H-dependent oxidoreductase subunit E [Alphaproteobacteria bacterium]
MTTVAITPMNEQQHTGQTPKTLGLNLVWDKAEKAKVKSVLAKYPKGRERSATIPLLKLAQDKCGGWLPVDAMQLVADTVNEPYIRVYEVATFYTMFNLKPVGKFHVQVCTNCACLIRGSDGVTKAVKDIAGVDSSGATSKDGTFTFTEVECLGACVAAPMMQIGTHYFTHLTEEKTKDILNHLKEGGDPLKYADTPNAASDPLHNGDYEEHV